MREERHQPHTCSKTTEGYGMSIGIWQLLLILIIIFVLFGAGKLPSVLKDVGKGVKNLKEGLGDGAKTVDDSTSMKDVTPEEDQVSKNTSSKEK